MDHTLTEQELSRFREAFTNWDVGDGTIRWADLCKAMEEVGETPPSIIRKLCERPDCEDERIDFEEFLRITVGPPWEATALDEKEVLTEAIAEFDDGDGYVSLRDLMRILQPRMVDSGYNPADGDPVDAYHRALDGSVFEIDGGGMAPEVTWKVFQEELAGVRKGTRANMFDNATAGQASFTSKCCKRTCCEMVVPLRFVRLGPAKCFRQLCSHLGWQHVDTVAVSDQAGGDEESIGETARMINITVVDFGGNQLMLDAVASTWSVGDLKQHIETFVGVAVHRQFLYLAGDDGFRRGLFTHDSPLCEAGLVDGSTLVLAAKDEVKVDYKKFVARLMDVEFGHSSLA